MRKPSVRKRRFIRRMTGYFTEPVVRRVRVATGREQHLTIGPHDIVLPPGHKLAYYRTRDPRYDVYAAEVLATLADGMDSVRVVDIGANVGDTAVLALGAHPAISVRSVEGNPEFVAYARRNLADFGPRAELIERFVGPVDGARTEYGDDGSTGGFGVGTPTSAGSTGPGWVSPEELLADAADHDLVVFKTDTDGFDIHILVGHWEAIDSASGVVWFEYDPFETLGDMADAPRLWRLLQESGRGLLIYDNLGNRMLSVSPGGEVERMLADLTAWLREQREGHVEVSYFDVWAVRPEHWFEQPRPELRARHTHVAG